MANYEIFPFILDKNSTDIHDHFVNNEDLDFSLKKRITSKSHLSISVKLTLCKEDYINFLTFVEYTINNSKDKFLSEINMYGEVDTYVCDIISYPKIALSNSLFDISFKVAVSNNK